MEPVQPISQPAEFSSAPRKKAKNKKLLIILAAVILLGAGAFAFSRSQSAPSTEISPTPEFAMPTEAPLPTESLEESPTPEEEQAEETPEPTEKPTPTAKPAATKSSELNIQVLNGSGETGVASTAKSFLSGKGYEYIETGNADNYDYEGVTLKTKESVSEYVADLKSDLEEKYSISSDSDVLSEDSVFDAVVIVGK